MKNFLCNFYKLQLYIILMNIAIIGGGIAGLSAATTLKELGNNVTIFEKHDQLGGMVRSTFDKLSNFHEHTPRVFFNNYYNFWNIMERIPIYYQKRSTEKRLIDIFQDIDSNYIVDEYGLTPSGIFKLMFRSRLNLLELIVLGIWMIRYFFSCTERLEDDADRVRLKSFIKNKAGIRRWEMLSSIMGETLDVLPIHKLVRAIEQNLFVSGLKTFKGNQQEFLFNNWELYLRSIETTLVKGRSVERIVYENNSYSIYCDKGVFKGFSKIIVATDLWNMIKLFEQSNIKIHEHLYELAEETKSNQMGINIYFPNSIPFKSNSIYAIEDSDWKLIVDPKDSNWKESMKIGVWTVSIPDDNFYSTRLRKKVKECTENEIYEEVWYQIKNSRIFDNCDTPKEQIKPSYLKIWEGWENVNGKMQNKEPYFWNAVGTNGKRPQQNIGMKDIFLAGGYTKTSYYHYWVEGACESGLKCAQLIDYRVKIFEHKRLGFLSLFHKIDKLLYDEYLPNVIDMSIIIILGIMLYKYKYKK